MRLTKENIEEARKWLDEQRAVVHPGPIETIREALDFSQHGTVGLALKRRGAAASSMEQGGISDRLSNFDEWGDRNRERS